MGCWNGTDALTQLAIRYEEPTRLFLLTPHDSWKGEAIGGGFTYPDDCFEPFMLPLLGKYDDGGCISDIKADLNTTFIEEWFNASVKKGEVTFTERCEELDEKPKKNKTLTIQEILNLIERGYVNVTIGYRPERPITMMLMLDSVYKAALAFANDYENQWGEKKKIVEDLSVKCDTLFTSEKTLLAFEGTIDNDKKMKEHCKLSFNVDRDREKFFCTGRKNTVLQHDFFYWLRSKHKTGESDIFEKSKQGLLDYVMLDMFMASSRKAYVPQCGSGSQDDSYDSQKMLAETTIAICKKRKKERD